MPRLNVNYPKYEKNWRYFADVPYRDATLLLEKAFLREKLVMPSYYTPCDKFMGYVANLNRRVVLCLTGFIHFFPIINIITSFACRHFFFVVRAKKKVLKEPSLGIS